MNIYNVPRIPKVIGEFSFAMICNKRHEGYKTHESNDKEI